MKLKGVGLAVIAGAALLCATLPAFSQLSVKITSGGPYKWTNSLKGGDGSTSYVGVYSALITSGKKTYATGFVCDDYNAVVTLNKPWNAKEVWASSLTVANVAADTKFGASIGVRGYAVVAALVEDIFQSKGGKDTIGATTYSVAELNSAIWFLTAGNTAKIGLDANAKSLLASLEALYGTNAAALAALASDTHLAILDVTPANAQYGQEGWIPVPEGGATALYLLLVLASCFGVMFFVPRKPVGVCQAL